MHEKETLWGALTCQQILVLTARAKRAFRAAHHLIAPRTAVHSPHTSLVTPHATWSCALAGVEGEEQRRYSHRRVGSYWHAQLLCDFHMQEAGL
jgi:hypothetical protein